MFNLALPASVKRIYNLIKFINTQCLQTETACCYWKSTGRQKKQSWWWWAKTKYYTLGFSDSKYTVVNIMPHRFFIMIKWGCHRSYGLYFVPQRSTLLVSGSFFFKMLTVSAVYGRKIPDTLNQNPSLMTTAAEHQNETTLLVTNYYTLSEWKLLTDSFCILDECLQAYILDCQILEYKWINWPLI